MAQDTNTIEQPAAPNQTQQPQQRTQQPHRQQTPLTQREHRQERGEHREGQGHAERGGSRPVFVPPADIYETGDSLIVNCELPGVGSDGVDITLERRVLTIRARAAAHRHTGYQRVYAEYSDSDYERVFTLSEDIDRDRIEATAKDGVLHLVLPKAAPAKARKIELKPG